MYTVANPSQHAWDGPRWLHALRLFKCAPAVVICCLALLPASSGGQFVSTSYVHRKVLLLMLKLPSRGTGCRQHRSLCCAPLHQGIRTVRTRTPSKPVCCAPASRKATSTHHKKVKHSVLFLCGRITVSFEQRSSDPSPFQANPIVCMLVSRHCRSSIAFLTAA
jgi:hypothetical protein